MTKFSKKIKIKIKTETNRNKFQFSFSWSINLKKHGGNNLLALKNLPYISKKKSEKSKVFHS
jgi:hypothetical protein